MSGEQFTLDQVLKELQIDEAELKQLVKDGDLRAVQEPDGMTFARKDVMALKEERAAERTISMDRPPRDQPHERGFEE